MAQQRFRLVKNVNETRASEADDELSKAASLLKKKYRGNYVKLGFVGYSPFIDVPEGDARATGPTVELIRKILYSVQNLVAMEESVLGWDELNEAIFKKEVNLIIDPIFPSFHRHVGVVPYIKIPTCFLVFPSRKGDAIRDHLQTIEGLWLRLKQAEKSITHENSADLRSGLVGDLQKLNQVAEFAVTEGIFEQEVLAEFMIRAELLDSKGGVVHNAVRSVESGKLVLTDLFSSIQIAEEVRRRAKQERTGMFVEVEPLFGRKSPCLINAGFAVHPLDEQMRLFLAWSLVKHNQETATFIRAMNARHVAEKGYDYLKAQAQVVTAQEIEDWLNNHGVFERRRPSETFLWGGGKRVQGRAEGESKIELRAGGEHSAGGRGEGEGRGEGSFGKTLKAEVWNSRLLASLDRRFIEGLAVALVSLLVGLALVWQMPTMGWLALAAGLILSVECLVTWFTDGDQKE